MFYLYDLYPKQTGEKRFEITNREMPNERLLCRDNSRQNLQESRELLLNDWERRIGPKKGVTPSKLPFICVTGHSRDGLTTYYQPWYQIKEEVIKRGFEFFD